MKTRKNTLMLTALLFSIPMWGQQVTYNHDASKLGQIMVMELGAGSLTPEIYYRLTHNSYRKGAKAPTSVKNTLRTATQIASIWPTASSRTWRAAPRLRP